MFLKQVYQHSKGLFTAMIIFILLQLFISYNQGMVLSPFYNYGMYSEVFTIQKNYQLFEVVQNGKRLRGQDFSPEQWDRIMLPLQYFSGINKSNDLYHTTVKRLLTKINISAKEENFISNCNYRQFEDWYTKYLEQVTKEPVSSLSIYYRTYRFSNNKLEATDSVLLLSQLCQ